MNTKRFARTPARHTSRRPVVVMPRAPLAPLPTVGANDHRYFARIEAALYVTDPATGKGLHLCEREQCVLFAALNAARDNGSIDAAHLAARLDAL